MYWPMLSGRWTTSHYLWNSKLCCTRGVVFLRSPNGFSPSFFFIFSSAKWLFELPFFLNFRCLMIVGMMEPLPTCGHVGSFYLYCLQVICLLMTLILWTCIKKWAFYLDPAFCTYFAYSSLLIPSTFWHWQISVGEFTCPSWLSLGAMKLISRILDANPMTVSKCPILSFTVFLHCRSYMYKFGDFQMKYQRH